MKTFIVLLVISTSLSAFAQRTAGRGTHLMGSGSKNVEGLGVNKDRNKYDDLEEMSEEELQKEEVGNNPTSTDTIKGQNSRKVKN